MKTSKIQILIAAALMFCVSAAFSQERAPRSHRKPTAEQAVKQLSSVLSLSEKQQEQIEKLYEDHFEAMKKSKEELRKKVKQERKDLEKEVNALLTNTQKKQFAAFLEGRRSWVHRSGKNCDRPCGKHDGSKKE